MTHQLAAIATRLVAAVCLLSASATAASAQINCLGMGPSAGPPVLNDPHIFCGEINAHGNAVGFHSRPGGNNPVEQPPGGPAVQIIGGGAITFPAGAPQGIYRLNNFTITRGGVGPVVKAFSTMFPDTCGQAAVAAAIRNAAIGAAPNAQFNGNSGVHCLAGVPPAPFAIQGYTNAAGTILTGYPNY